ncbi:HEAT repeat domain-containing protein [Halomicroarcula sp. F28]|uniref:HEAT repeat domain-containing protein n=1 Tax=Haloarcula salinisoli TaxID=2487746 RepID=UPI001C73C95D|nr:HEAT repeat domain-containing protein [Halomicroarcula salinisoli]MBX0284892.1 HEAT repeat domain-containing protein [Halomicroarcula salinisoli]
MSNGDDETADSEAADEETSDVPDTTVTVEGLQERLDEAKQELEAAETEAALDGVEERLDSIESDVEGLPEPDEDDDEAEDPAEEIESRLSDLRDDLEAQRGPYAEDVVGILEDAQTALTDSEWTDDGEEDALAAVESFLAEVADYAEAEAGDSPADAADALGTVADVIEAESLDPDADEDSIAELLAAAEGLEEDLEAAEVWGDLTVQEQLDAKGFYDILTNENRKDFPPEWNAAKLHAREGNLELVLYAFDKLGSDFMEEYFLDIFYHLGSDAEPAFEKMHELAQKRNKGPIEVLGKIGDDRACETLHEFIEDDGDPALQKVTLRSLGAIGSETSVQPVANRLAAESDEVRSVAARALGLLGDTRAVEPLADVLEGDDSDEVRASAAWALRQIGTEEALEEAAKYTDDRAYLVQSEAEKAAGA